jgi:hypothetical protein
MIYIGSSLLNVNAAYGATDGATIRLTNGCALSNPDCTWTWQRGQLISDRTGTTLPINALNGAVFGADLKLNSACSSGNADCVFNGLYAK